MGKRKDITELLAQKRLWWMGENNGVNQLYGLYDLIKENFYEDSVLLEVGSFAGVSTELFAQICKKVYAVDPWDLNKEYAELHPTSVIESEKRFDLMASKYDNIVKMKRFSQNVHWSFGNSTLDVVYIDGEHLYEPVKRDINLWLPKVKDGGILCGHDFGEPGVKQALDEIFPYYNFKTYSDSSWVYLKLANN